MRRDAHTYHRPQKCGIGIEKFGGKMPALQQGLRAVKILENQAQQLRALNDSLLDVAPLVGWNQEWDNVDFPGPVCAEGSL